jgi:uncharacterized protein YlzI (FlbEa/FlbD family)
MIRLTRLNGSEMYLNADLVATVEAHPDTVITLVDGKHFVVHESAGHVVELLTVYRSSILALADRLASAPDDALFDTTAYGADAANVDNRAKLYVLHGEQSQHGGD